MSTLAAEFHARLPVYLLRKDQHPELHLAMGASNTHAMDAATALLRVDAGLVAAAGTLDDSNCLLGHDIGRTVPDSATMVPLTSRADALAALNRTDGIVIDDEHTVSLATVVRIAMVPANVAMLAKLSCRKSGLQTHWSAPTLGFLADFRKTLHDLLAQHAHNVRDDIMADVVLTLQRFSYWLTGLRLPSPADVLATWSATMPALSPAAIDNAVIDAPAADWHECVDTLCGWLTARAHGAARLFVDAAWLAKHTPIDNIHARTADAAAHLATVYLRMRYLDALPLYDAVLAIDNYLTATVRLAYSGLVPELRMQQSRTAANNVDYTASRTRTSTTAITRKSGLSYAGRIINRLRVTPVLEEALTAGPHAQFSFDTMCLAVFAALVWRWIYITHLVPVILPVLRTIDRITPTLAAFVRPDVPARTPMTASLPRLLDTVRSYLDTAWSVRTIDVRANTSAISLDIPYGGAEPMPTYIMVSPAPLNAPEQPPTPESSDTDDYPDDADNPDESTSDAAPVAKTKRVRRSRNDSSISRFARRQNTLLSLKFRTADKEKGRAESAMPQSDWGNFAFATSIAIPRPRTRLATRNLTLLHRATTLPSIPTCEADVAPMPLVHPPTEHGTITNSVQDTDRFATHILDQIRQHAEVIPKLIPRPKDNDPLIRPRQFVGLYMYYVNQCQTALPGLRVLKRAQERVMPTIQRALNIKKSRGRHLRVLRKSPLHPLALRLLHMERTNQHSTISDLLFDAPGAPVLHPPTH